MLQTCNNNCVSTDARSTTPPDSSMLHELLAPRGPMGCPRHSEPASSENALDAAPLLSDAVLGKSHNTADVQADVSRKFAAAVKAAFQHGFNLGYQANNIRA